MNLRFLPVFSLLGFSSIVSIPAQLAGELSVLNLDSNGGVNPATGAAWREGDEYRLAFVTSATTQAVSTEITYYNSFVQTVAQGAGLGAGIWKVIGSTETISAKENTGTDPIVNGTGVPIFLMDGATLFAVSNSDLWNGSSVTLGIDETGAPTASAQVFTGTLENGDRDTEKYLGEMTDNGSGFSIVTSETGVSGGTEGRWISVLSSVKTFSLPVYALSNPLKVSAISFSMNLQISRNDIGRYDFEWRQRSGKKYALVSSSDLSTPINSWTVYDDGSGPYQEIIFDGHEKRSLSNLVSADSRRFFAIVESDIE